MNSKHVIITGVCGGIGKSLCDIFQKNNFAVIGIDKHDCKSKSDNFINVDLNKLCVDNEYRIDIISELNSMLNNKSLHVLVNNAAIQVIKPFEELSIQDWNTTINVNLLSAFILSKELVPYLEKNNGSILNISSVHTKLSKPNFTCYSTSKTALNGLTKGMALDMGPRVRVNAICPAAVDTDMLREGFNNPEKIKELADMHPSEQISKPEDVAKLALYISNSDLCSLTGTSIFLDGGISNRLHDPN